MMWVVDWGVTFSEDCNYTGNEEFQDLLMDSNLYPNPTNGHFTIQLANELYDEVTVEVRNAGQLLQVKLFTNVSQIELTLDDNPGVYFVYLKSTNQQANYKVLKE
jgi:hypothetical protein